MLVIQERTSRNKQLADDGVGVGVVANDVVLVATEGEAEESDVLVVAAEEVPPLVLLLVGPIVALMSTSR